MLTYIAQHKLFQNQTMVAFCTNTYFTLFSMNLMQMLRSSQSNTGRIQILVLTNY